MRVILTRMPALEAALLRFDLWWGGLSHRERVLLSVLGSLLALTVLIFGVVKPLQAARAQAMADIRTYETLSARVRAAGTLAPPAPRRQGPAVEVVNQSATAFGLVVTPEAMTGGVRVAIADVTYDSLMAWLADLSATSDLRVRRLSIQRRPEVGRVSANVEFGG
ncbi:type II secretion system protein GspM [Sphingomonas sp. M1-B02]|uniref:type II secretion system protein GspM n=1 Tax=Sphingomonas sp. M1-B02 TaxID=3114300 RepID=UPI00223FDB5C|nr:type II secretion system protein GspM [Sphingomonas sp. S6-11]UZK67467.1 type II secretion system protein M [Sphingomonas sp. S6-11]